MIRSFGPYQFDLSKKTLVMGILNVTPDSFSDGGQYSAVRAAVKHAKQLVVDGADMIDVGGESTRPGAATVSLEEELERVIPIISALSKEVDVPISIDTYKAETAKRALDAGAHIINDVWGAKADANMAKVAAEYNAPIILMHNRPNKKYHQFIPDAIADISESIALVRDSGVQDENIILDPGIGFAKNYNHNIEMMKNLDLFTRLGYPVLLGTSRKSFIGITLDLPIEERVEGTGATVCLGVSKGCQIVRVHDVKQISRMTKMMDVMLGKRGIE